MCKICAYMHSNACGWNEIGVGHLLFLINRHRKRSLAYIATTDTLNYTLNAPYKIRTELLETLSLSLSCRSSKLYVIFVFSFQCSRCLLFFRYNSLNLLLVDFNWINSMVIYFSHISCIQPLKLLFWIFGGLIVQRILFMWQTPTFNRYMTSPTNYLFSSKTPHNHYINANKQTKNHSSWWYLLSVDCV